MKQIRISLCSFLLMLCLTTASYCQKEFKGIFTMQIETSDLNDNEYPLYWSIEEKRDGGKMGMKMLDDQFKKGVIKRVVFNPTDSTWLMLMEINKIKQGTKIHRAAMFRDSTEKSALKLIKSNQTKVISGFKCSKYQLTTEKYKSEIWITDQFNCNIPLIYKLLRHCGMIESPARKGDWYKAKINKGMILEITSLNLATKEEFSLKISNLQYGNTDKTLFDISDYKISVIPEGQNCGTKELEN